jgi:hypothetical protein
MKPLHRWGALVALMLSSAACARDRPPAPGAGDSAARPVIIPEAPKAGDALPARPTDRVREARVNRDTTVFGTGPLVVRFVTGDSVLLADSALRVWRLADGALVAWSALDGAGGYENEGQSVWLYDVASGARRRVVSDYYQIVDVALAGSAERALVVTMQDGAVGSLHIAIADPARGTVYRATNARARATATGAVIESFGDGETPVTMSDTRTPIRVDTIAVARTATMPLVMVARSGEAP